MTGSLHDPHRTTDLFEHSNLTHSQCQIWLGQKLHPDVPLYNMALAFTIHGVIQPEPFQQAFQTLINRHDTLRTVIEEVDGIPQRRVLAPFSYVVELLDFASEANPNAAYEAWIETWRGRLFNLAHPLFDTALIKLADDRFVWYLNQHHLITDGWSKAVLYQDMAALYRAALANSSIGDSTVPRFEDYVDFERSSRLSAPYQKAVAFWRDKASDPPEPVRFYSANAVPQSLRTERVRCDLGTERTAALKTLAAETGHGLLTLDISIFNLLATLLFVYLHRVSGAHDLAIGAPAHNRLSSTFKETLGLFIELFPLRIEIDEDDTFDSLMATVGRETHYFLRYAQPGASHPELSRTYNVILNYINVSFPSFNGVPMQSEWIHPGFGDRGHSLRLQVHDFDATGSWQLHFDFNAEVFDVAQRRHAVDHFLRVVDAFITDPNQPIGQVSLLGPEDRQQLLGTLNPPPPDRATLIRLFEAQASRTPDELAVRTSRSGNPETPVSSLTYRELNSRANQLAHYLRKRGVGPGVIVGMCLRRSPEMLVAVYGILKAGAAYLPLDATYPLARLAFMLEDTQAPLVLTHSNVRASWPTQPPSAGPGADIICVDTQWEAIAKEATDNLVEQVQPEQLAYVIYTSGSTGMPKGVMISHRALAHYVGWAKTHYVTVDKPAFPLYSSVSFDLTVTSLFVPLIAGGSIVVYGEDDSTGNLAILRVIDDDAVDLIKLTPSHLALIRNAMANTTRCRAIILGGEDLKTDLAQAMITARPDLAIYNEYGPTEATVGCMVHRFDPDRDRATSVPIGTPIDNMRVYLLDAYRTPVPTGVVGEIYVAGDGIADGYLQRSALTVERFLPDLVEPYQPMYRTGDLARWSADEQIEFLGRADQQVKIRGARIELGEVEAALLAHDDIHACVVDVGEDQAEQDDSVDYCLTCGLPTYHPEAGRFNADGVCRLCQEFERYQDNAMAYFKTMDDLREIVRNIQAAKPDGADCLMLLSGGKDSTYVLYQLVELGLTPLVFHLDNGFISDGAKANIQRVVDSLGLELVVGTTPSMNAIFADSLTTFSNVCNGCFKTIYTLSMNLARERGINHIITGLSRGQIFETRLADLFRQNIFDAEQIDELVVQARKAYHRMDDVVSQCLDVELFQHDATFEEIQFVDFYRYCDVPLDEMLTFLDQHAPWIRPEDTGRSTNCLINDVGIYVHKQERGFHNYALPYSWDVRLGHKTRTAALAELDDQIDASRVEQILHDIGYERTSPSPDQADKRLVAYYVATQPLTVTELRRHLANQLPDYMIPAHYVPLDTLPLTANGKVDRSRLTIPDRTRPELEEGYTAPRTAVETTLAEIWSHVLGVAQVGVHDNFIELGGDSILNIQIVARANQAGLRLSSRQLFTHPTIAELATVVGTASRVEVDQGLVTGTAPLTPIQRWFLDQQHPNPQHWNQAIMLTAAEPLDVGLLEQAMQHVYRHHDALRLRFIQTDSGWWQSNTDVAADVTVQHVDLTARDATPHETAIQSTVMSLHSSFDLSKGNLIRVALIELGPNQPQRLVIVVHHLAVDGVSWPILLEDLETVYRQLRQGTTAQLPAKTMAFKQWAETLVNFARSQTVRGELEFWLAQSDATSSRLPRDYAETGNVRHASTQKVSVALTVDETRSLLQDVPGVYNTRMDEVLLTALGQALSQWTGMTAITIDLEHHGRDEIAIDTDVSRTVGWFTALFPVRLDIGNLERNEPGETLKAIKEQLRAVPNRGIGYGLLRYLSDDPNIIAQLSARPPAEVLFNYLGQLDRVVSASSLFKLKGELTGSYSPRNRRPHVLEVNAFIIEGQLHIDLTYSDQVHEQQTIDRVASQCIDRLRALITHCLSPEAGGHTPSDFPLANLDEQTFNRLASLLNKTDTDRE